MRPCRKWGLVLVGVGLMALAGCNDRKGGGWFGQEAANPDAAARQQCADAGYEPGSVQFMQCMGGRSQPQE
jgi:hypothetical protein